MLGKQLYEKHSITEREILYGLKLYLNKRNKEINILGDYFIFHMKYFLNIKANLNLTIYIKYTSETKLEEVKSNDYI